jgi:hypothetical protein
MQNNIKSGISYILSLTLTPCDCYGMNTLDWIFEEALVTPLAQVYSRIGIKLASGFSTSLKF